VIGSISTSVHSRRPARHRFHAADHARGYHDYYGTTPELRFSMRRPTGGGGQS